MMFEVYTFKFTHEVWDDGEFVKRDEPILYRYTSIRPLGNEQMREMIEHLSDAILENWG